MNHQSSKHWPALDGLRGIAISMVMAFHFFQGRPAPLGRMAKFLSAIAHNGQTGVDLFFVLSGFLITGILLDSKDHPHCLRNFYIRRTLRIFPLYYGVLFILFIMIPVIKGGAVVPWSTQWWYWTYSQDVGFAFLKNHIAGPNHFWSLAVEEHFYLLWPFVVFRHHTGRLLQILVCILIASIPLRAVMTYAGYDVFFFTLSRMDGLAAGAILAVLFREPLAWRLLIRRLRQMMPIYVPILLMLQITCSGTPSISFKAFKYTGIALFYFGVIALTLSNGEKGRLTRLLSVKPLTVIGKYSYSMYVFHPFIYYFFNATFYRSLLPAFVLQYAATFIAGWCSWQLWESPFLKLKRYFPSST